MYTQTDLTPAQQKIMHHLKTNGGSADTSVIQARGLDLRAANNLVRKDLLTLTNGVYRLRDQKSVEPAKEPVTKAANTAAAPEPAKGKKTAEKTKKESKTKTEKVVELRDCLCGCGSQSKSRFKPGHDARLHSVVLRIHRGKAPREELPSASATLDYLKAAPWMTDEIAAAIGLDRQGKQEQLFD